MNKKIVIDQHYYDYDVYDRETSWTDYTYHIYHEDGRTESFTSEGCDNVYQGLYALLKHLGWSIEDGEYNETKISDGYED